MIRFECSKADDADARLVFKWRNDPAACAMSFNTAPLSWHDFRQEYLTEMFAMPELPPLFLIHDNRRIGHIFFRRGEHPIEPALASCVISINIAPEERRKGFGTKALQALTPWVARQGFEAILAYVKTENLPSHKIFLACGYERLMIEKSHIVYGLSRIVEKTAHCCYP